jgi:hypothetical protein
MSAHTDDWDLLPTLAPPPRAVPFLLRCRLLANGPAVWGSIIFGLASLLTVPLALGMDPLGSLRLALNRQEAPGRVVAERDTFYEENDARVRRHDYTFRLPDGTVLRGHSYSRGHRYLNDPPAPGGPNPRRLARVTVEYDPGHPQTNRIKGTSTHPVSHWVAFIFIIPAVVLLIAVCGLIGGWRQVRLLCWGEPAWAILTSGKHPTDAESRADLPVIECQRLLAARAEMFAWSPFVYVWNGVIGLWCAGVVLMIAAGAVFIGFMIGKVLLDGAPVMVNGQPAQGAQGALPLAGFLVLWVFVGAVMFAFGRRLRQTPRNLPKVDCAYEFCLPDGEVIRSRDSVPFTALADPWAPFPVLYNRNRPDESLLLAALPPPVPEPVPGGWQTPAHLGSFLRLAVALLALVGGPVVSATYLGW